MIPSVVASEVTGALRDFLATGFGPSNPALAGVVDDFLAEPENLAKGPYLSIALPFQPAPEGGEPFPEVPLGFTPYRHQRIAFSRLAASSDPRGDGSAGTAGRSTARTGADRGAAAGTAGRSTIIATGTGSGKTECFLFPILDYCRAQSPAPGIKAVLIYPMNALASDQARRIARTIDRTPAPPGEDREEAIGLAAPELRPLLATPSKRGMPVPEVGFELAGDREAPIAEAELA